MIKDIFPQAINFFHYYSAKIEIVRGGLIQEVHFIKMPYTLFLDDSDKKKFNLAVDRSTTLTKVRELLKEVDYFDVIMRFAYFLKDLNFITRILFNYQNMYTFLAFAFVAQG